MFAAVQRMSFSTLFFGRQRFGLAVTALVLQACMADATSDGDPAASSSEAESAQSSCKTARGLGTGETREAAAASATTGVELTCKAYGAPQCSDVLRPECYEVRPDNWACFVRAKACPPNSFNCKAPPPAHDARPQIAPCRTASSRCVQTFRLADGSLTKVEGTCQ